MNKILILPLKLLSFTPRVLLYPVSDFLFLLNKYFFKYRYSVVEKNLREAFPEKSAGEISQIRDKFYHQFFDLIIESFKLINYSLEKIDRIVKYKNTDILNNLFEKKRSIAIVSGHTGNWEIITNLPDKLIAEPFYIYHPLRNKFFDYLVNSNRSRYGWVPVAMKDVMRKALNKHSTGENFALWFLADQRPGRDSKFWVKFLNHDTAFYVGPAKMAQKLNMAIVYLSNTRISRGHYHVKFDILCENPKQHTEFELMKMYADRLESEIQETPHNWLWSHKRWKHSLPDNISLYTGEK